MATFNGSSQVSQDLIGIVSSSFVTWVLNDLLPPFFGFMAISLVLAGVILQALVMTAVLTRGPRVLQPVHRIIIHITGVDLAALLLVGVPDIVSSVIRTWQVDALCWFHGVCVNVFFVMVFSYVVWSGVERAVKLRWPKAWYAFFIDYDGRWWKVLVSVNWIVVFVWFVILPLWNEPYQYVTHGFQCDIPHQDHVLYTNVHFSLVYFLTGVLWVFLGSLVVDTRRRKLTQSGTADYWSNSWARGSVRCVAASGEGTAVESPEHVPHVSRSGTRIDKLRATGLVKQTYSVSGSRSAVSARYAAHDHASAATPVYSRQMFGDTVESPVHVDAASETSRTIHVDLVLSPRTLNAFIDDDSYINAYGSRSPFTLFEELEEFHIAATMFLSSGLVYLLWLPYVGVAYRYLYEDPQDPAWDGWYAFGVVCTLCAYVTRPVVYVAHNKSIRQMIRDMFPRAAVQRTENTSRNMSHKWNKDGHIIMTSSPTGPW